jgi:hypothetical protein
VKVVLPLEDKQRYKNTARWTISEATLKDSIIKNKFYQLIFLSEKRPIPPGVLGEASWDEQMVIKCND